MKNLLLILILFLESIAFGQNDSIEKAIILKKFINKEITQEDFAKMGMRWNQLIRDMDKYPEIPLDKNDQVHYSFINTYEGFSKDKLFARTMEWLAIYYGLMPLDFYSSSSDAKIIYRNSAVVNARQNCNYTTIISIKEEKMWIEVVNIVYENFHEGYYKNENWIPEKTTYQNISEVFPVVLKNSNTWESQLKLLKWTNEVFQTDFLKLGNYINGYESTYSF